MRNNYTLYLMNRIFITLLLISSVISIQTNAQSISTNGLQLWLKSDSGIVTSSNKVIEWKDISGNNNHCLQTDPSLQPLINTNLPNLNNKNSIVMDGVDDFMSFSTRISDIRTVFFVLRHSGNIVAFEPVLGDDIGYDFIGDDFSATLFNPAYTNVHILNGNIRINKMPLATVLSAQKTTSYSIVSLTTTGNVAASRLTKDRANASRVWNGEYSEVIIYNRLLGSTEIDSIENYLVGKYAPTLNLGPDIVTNQTNGCIPDSPIILQANPNFQTYLWSTGETSNQISTTQYGNYSVVATDNFGIPHYDTISITVPQINFHYPNTLFCSGDTLLWDTELSHSNNSFVWQNSSSDSLLAITQSGQYYVSVLDSFGCQFNSDTLSIALDNFPGSISLGSDTSLCEGNIITLTSGNGPGLNYIWNDNSINDSLTIVASGQYHISATNSNNCVARDTINVIVVGQAPIAGFTNSLTCQNSSINFNDTSFALGGNTITNWFWNFGDTVATNDTSIVEQPNYTFTDTGSYAINLTVTTNVGCRQNIVKNIYVYPSPTVSLGSDTTFCGGNSITPVSVSGDGLTYLWNDTSSNDSLIINASGQYSIIVTNSDNCIAKDTINITVPGFAPTAAFINSLTCKNNSVTFTDNSTPPSGDFIMNWNWDFGNTSTLGDTSILQNASYTYADTGNYVVSLDIETNVGCKQTFIKNIHVAPLPIVNFSNVIACKNDSALFTNSSSSPGYNPLTYLWNFGDDSTSTLVNPEHIFPNQLTYPVELIVSNSFGCKDSLTKNISVKAEVSADFSYTTPCTNTFVAFQDNSIAPNPNSSNIRTWTIGASTFTGLSITQSFPSPGNYTVKLTVSGFNGCNSSIVKNIMVMAPPIPQFSVSPVCLNDTLEPIDQSLPQNGSISSWNWQLDNVTFSTNPISGVVPSTSGNHSLKLVVSNNFGCKDSVNNPVTIFSLPVVDFTTNPTSNFYLNEAITFTPNNMNGTLYDWTLDSTNSSNAITVYTFDTIGTQSASLYMEDTNGCGNSITKNLLIQSRILDLAILDIRTTYGNDDFITIETDLANLGTVPVSTFEISAHVTDASSIKETWTGTPSSSSFFTYVFSSKIKQLTKNPHYITCVNIESVNAVSDFEPNNNKLCVTSNLGSTNVSDPFPNPTKENLMLPIVLTKESEISFFIVDLLGQIVGETYTIEGSTGLNMISIPTSELGNSQYILKILIDGKPFIKKFTKLNQF